MKHTKIKVVQNAIKTVEKSRENDEAKRKYWRVLNEQYYGLDIHPLMECEIDELEKLLYACTNPKTMNTTYIPVLIGATAIASSLFISYFIVKYY